MLMMSTEEVLLMRTTISVQILYLQEMSSKCEGSGDTSQNPVLDYFSMSNKVA